MNMFDNIAKPVKKNLSIPTPDDKCGVCGEEAGNDSFIISGRHSRGKGRKPLIHCFDCYEAVMDDILFG